MRGKELQYVSKTRTLCTVHPGKHAEPHHTSTRRTVHFVMHAHMVGDRSIDETAKATVPTPEVSRTAVVPQKGHGITLIQERTQSNTDKFL